MRSYCTATLDRWPAVRRDSLWKRPTVSAGTFFAILALALVEAGSAQAENCVSSYPANSLDRKTCLCRQFLSTRPAPGCRRSCGPSTGYQRKEAHCGPLTRDAPRSPALSPESGPRLATRTAKSEPPPKPSEKLAPSSVVANPQPPQGSTSASPGRSDSVRGRNSKRPADGFDVNAARKLSAAVKPVQRAVSNPQQSHPPANADHAHGHPCFNVDPQTRQRCIAPPGSPVVDMNTTLSDGTPITRFNWQFTNGCTRDIQVTVKQDNGSIPMLLGGKHSLTFYCLSFEGCHEFTSYSEKCGR
jgi:hypothetical protein